VQPQREPIFNGRRGRTLPSIDLTGIVIDTPSVNEPSTATFAAATGSNTPIRPDGAQSPASPSSPGPPRERRYSRPVASAQWSNHSREANSRTWFTQRLAGIEPTDFHSDGVAIYTTSAMPVPEEFQGTVYTINESHRQHVLQYDEIQMLNGVVTVLVFCDIFDQAEVELALALNVCITSLGGVAPPIVLVPHGSPDMHRTENADEEFDILSQAMCNGIDCAIIGEPEGIRLACAVRAEIMSQAGNAEFFNRVLHKNQMRVQHCWALEDAIDEGLWDYLRARLKTGIPALKYDVLGVACVPGSVIHNWRISKLLGQGGSGKVYALEDRDAPQPPASERSASSAIGRAFELLRPLDAQVLKTIPKNAISSMAGLKILRNEINVMGVLSSQDWQHPNIIKLHEVYHLETHILFRMEDGGSVDLFKCLRQHELTQRPLGPHKARTIILESTAALCHLHLGPRIVHRDIKPENIIVRETLQDLTVKLCDFDLARIIPEDCLSTFLGGTIPFMAPEIVGGRPYDPFPTDIWSLSIVFLEVLCGCGILSRALAFQRISDKDPQRRHKEKAMTEQIENFFLQPGSVDLLLGNFHSPDNTELVMVGGPIQQLLGDKEGMLCVEAKKRMTARMLQKGIERVKQMELAVSTSRPVG